MVRDLGVEEATAQRDARQPAATGAGRPVGGRRARARAEGGNGSPPPPPADGPSSSGNGEGDAKDRKPRNRRHGRPR
jgi:SecD/SecF fusion protein